MSEKFVEFLVEQRFCQSQNFVVVHAVVFLQVLPDGIETNRSFLVVPDELIDIFTFAFEQPLKEHTLLARQV